MMVMSNQNPIIRKGQAGQPTSNTGEFAAKTNDPADIELPPVRATFTDSTGSTFQIFADGYDEEGFNIVGSGKTVTFRADADSTEQELITEAREFLAEDEFGDDEEDSSLFAFDSDGRDFEVEHVGGDSFELYENGRRVAAFHHLGDHEDHEAIQGSAEAALTATSAESE